MLKVTVLLFLIVGMFGKLFYDTIFFILLFPFYNIVSLHAQFNPEDDNEPMDDEEKKFYSWASYCLIVAAVSLLIKILFV